MSELLDELSPLACGARRFAGRVAVVTGGAQGIGKATALRLAAEGASVVIGDVAREPAEEVARHLLEHGAPAAALRVDLTRFDDAQRLMTAAVSEFGSLDVLVNNVGGTLRVQPFEDYTEEQIRAEIDRSLWTAVWGCRAAVPLLMRQGRGAIVNVGSNAPRGILRVPYATAKGGVFALTTSLAAELAERGIRVNCVAPGGTVVTDRRTARSPAEEEPGYRQWFDTMVAHVVRSIPMGRRGTPEEQAAAIAFLASDDASFVTGQILSVAGGATVP